ncbi:MAG: ATP-dependent 6-phosphofructokinase [Merismopedia sp. SIO2A8]|nr:ATP-dependent 6-phosphofructokinase [Symploca sp. SIO2B6]NET50987.1 ATP-dependent 6-phosphofructokinase [Merismopedia sp. SIO2A8]
MGQRKRIGILTSGGDCPGLNCVIRAVISHATLTYNWEIVGIPNATQGLLERKAIALNLHGLDVHGIDPLLSMGGTYLGSTSKGNTSDHTSELLASYQALAIDALIAIGGDGSLAILRDLACQGKWNLVAIPKTIDNDVAITERAVGFDTAVNTITESLNRLTYTAASHDRVMIVEVMGRQSGHLALHAGIAGGADIILIPEIPYSIADICQKINALRDHWGRKFAIIVVAEGVKTEEGSSSIYTDSLGQVRLRGISQYISEQVAHTLTQEVETRVTVLGHVQRGGMPSALDRIVAAAFGKAAVDLIAQQQYDCMVAWQNFQVKSIPLEEVLLSSPLSVEPDSYLVQTARALGIYIGEGKNN